MKGGSAASVITGGRFAATPEKIWRKLMFFEQIPRRPPLLLRLLLPEPLRAEGRSSAVGDESRCIYKQGHLLKRVTEIDPERGYRFEVFEQKLAIGGGIQLGGGSYRLRALSGGSTRVELETRFSGLRRPRWLWRPIEAAVCHVFHRHLLDAIRIEVERPKVRFRTRPTADPRGSPPRPTS